MNRELKKVMRKVRMVAKGVWQNYRATVLIGIFVLYVFHTGFTSPDPIDQIRQARSGVYSDWHPVVMALIWSVLDRLIPGPMGMLLFNTVLFFLGLSWVADRFFPRLGWRRNLFLTGFLFFPSVLSMLGMVWKDVSMAAGLLFGLGAILKGSLLRSRKSLRTNARGWGLAGLAGLFYGLSVRLNALPAVLPLVISGFWIWQPKTFFGLSVRTSSRIQSVLWAFAQGCILTGIFFVSNSLLTKVLIGPKTSYPLQQVLIYDLGSMSMRTGQVLLPQFEGRLPPTLDLIRPKENLFDAAAIVNDGSFSAKNDGEYKLLKQAWLKGVREHFSDFIRIKWERFFRFISIVNPLSETYSHNFWPDDRLGYPHVSRVQNFLLVRIVRKYLEIWQRLPVFALGGYVILMFGALILAYRRGKLDAFKLGLGASAVCYLSAYFFVGTALNFRYGWWAVVCCLLVAALTGLEDVDEVRSKK